MPDVMVKAREAVTKELDEAEKTVLKRWEKHVKTVGIRKKGGPESGHYGHRGRPGKRGGSIPDLGSFKRHSDNVAIITKDNGATIWLQGPDSEEMFYESISILPAKAVQLIIDEKTNIKFFTTEHQGGQAGSSYQFTGVHNIVISTKGNRLTSYAEEWGHMLDKVMGTGRGRKSAYSRKKVWQDLMKREPTGAGWHTRGYGKATEDFALAFREYALDPERAHKVRPLHHQHMQELFGDSIEKEFTVEKQLPINEADKVKIFELRRNMFFDTSDQLAEQLFTGDITIGEWQESFKDQLRQYYSSSAAIGKGGWDEMGWDDWGRLGPVMKDQYEYLQGFAEHISDNRDDVTLKYIKARARLYGEGAGFPAALMEAGTVFEALLPWLPRDGSTECLNRCHCRWEHEVIRTEGQWLFVKSTWRLGDADHCPTCIARNGYTVTNRIHENVKIPGGIGGY